MRSTVEVGGPIGLRIASVLTLARKDRGDAVAPGFLDRGQDSRFVVHQDVVLAPDSASRRPPASLSLWM